MGGTEPSLKTTAKGRNDAAGKLRQQAPRGPRNRRLLPRNFAPSSSNLRKGVLIVKRFRGVSLLFFTAVLMALVVFGAQLQVPTVFAIPGFTSQHTVPLGANTCAGSGCHTSNGSPGSAVVTGCPSGMTYTPGTPIPLTVTVNDTTQTRFGFELTARLTSNTASQAGTCAAGTNSNTGTNVVPVIQGLATSPTFNFVWTLPARASGHVNFYLTGLAGSFPGADLYTAMYTLMPAVATPPPPPPTPPPTPNLSAAPTTMSFNYQTGGATPASQPILVSGTAASYTAAASGR